MNLSCLSRATIERRALLVSLGLTACKSPAGEQFCGGRTLALLDAQTLWSWEVCGQGRQAQATRPGFWFNLTKGLVVTRSIVTTSPDGLYVAVLDSSRFALASPGRHIVICQTDGTRVAETPFPMNRIGEVRVTSSMDLYVVGEMQGKQVDRVGLYRHSSSGGEWTKLMPLPGWPRQEATVTVAGESVLLSSGGKVVDALTARVVAKGDCAQLSVDGKLLYLRSTEGTPSIYSWPEMQPVSLKYTHRVGTSREWCPLGHRILLERTVLGVNRLENVNLVSGEAADQGMGRMTGQSGHAMRWIDWGTDGPEMLNRFEARYLR